MMSSTNSQQIAAAGTNLDELSKCTINLVDEHVDPCENPSAVPQSFVIVLVHSNKEYDVCLNERVTVGDIFRKLIGLNLFQLSDIDSYQLVKENDHQTSLDLSRTFANLKDTSRFLIQQKLPSPSPSNHIFVKTLTGKNLQINVCLETDSVASVKERINIQEGIPTEQQRLVFNGKQLEDNLLLSEYGVVNESCLHLILRLRKPVIRLKSTMKDRIIQHVNVSVELDPNVWIFSSLYPNPSLTDKKSHVQWNDLNVYHDGKIIFEQKKEDFHPVRRLYSQIDDEIEHRMLFWEATTVSSIPNFLQEKNLCVPRDNFSRILNYLLKKMTLSTEDRDDLITYVLSQLDEVDPAYENENVIFQFIPSQIYSRSVQLTIRPLPEQFVRIFLVFGFGDANDEISSFDDLEKEIPKVVINENLSSSGLIVHEWGTMFMY
ncbi:unnamed protein product [Adineta ricciae]|uniref:Ubiquitin-like domain-containing protein n=1 Tax=Adineta ricciae TaxID=249248 RepID=A0A814TN30_ADIRI|nr:unnamed protein product [Adineta ricciae]